MTDKELWRRMEQESENPDLLEKSMKFMLLLKTAYEKDMKLVIACTNTPGMPGMAQQGYIDVDGKRMLACYTSKSLAQHQSNHMQWNIAKARDVMNNMFNKPVIAGMVFNPGEEEKMVVIFKNLLEPLIPGEKVKPPHFRV